MTVALVAAYMLMLQSVLGAFALGNGPRAAQLDAFGNAICTHAGTGELPAEGQQQPGHVPNCCAFGCIMAGATFSPPPSIFAVSHSVVFESLAFVVPSPAPVPFPRERFSASPRAPPVTA